LGHKDLGEKTMLFLIDGLYGNENADPPPSHKWKMAPFNDAWPSSIFMSLDGVAIDSVGFDFLTSEWPNLVDIANADNYLREAALANDPPSKTVYDPERDGIRCRSLGYLSIGTMGRRKSTRAISEKRTGSSFSGELNPADGTYLNEFRIHEGVDTSYTKFNRKPDQIDDNPFDKIVPPADLPYVGWTEPGEWFNVSVDVRHAGTYAADFLYTSNRGGTISVDVNGKDATGPLEIKTTNDPADPLTWRQWHHWNLASQLFKVRLSKGKNVLTVHILTNGNMNLAYFDFKPVHE
jgi:hypothetical protein